MLVPHPTVALSGRRLGFKAPQAVVILPPEHPSSYNVLQEIVSYMERCDSLSKAYPLRAEHEHDGASHYEGQ